MSAWLDEYDKLFMEHFDVTDEETRKAYVSVSEAEKTELITSLTSKLYDKIVEKTDKIDYGSIPASRGDITKVENFESMMECLDLIRDILKQYGQDQESVDVIYTAVNNIREREKLFSRAFALDAELGIILYNTMVLAIVSSISFLIAGCIEYIKNPGDDTFVVSLDKVAYQKTCKNLLFEDLRKFNTACMNKDVDEAIEATIRGTAKHLTGSTILGVTLTITTIIALSKLIIPILRELTYFFYHSRQNVSDYFAIQADLLTMNASNIIYKDTTDKDKKKIKEKQLKIAGTFKKISNAFDIDYKKAEKEGKKLADSEKKKYKISDVSNDSLEPGGGASSIF